MVLASSYQKRLLGRSKAGTGAEAVKWEEEGQGMERGDLSVAEAANVLRRWNFPPSRPRAGESGFPARLGNTGSGMVSGWRGWVPQLCAEGVLTDVWGKDMLCTEPGCAAFTHVPASN